MADKKISQLTDLPAASVSPSNDVLAIVDTNVTETKKITAKALVDGALNAQTADAVVYLNNSKEAVATSSLTFNGTVLSTTTVDATNVEVTNVKAKDGTAALSIADSTGRVTASSGSTLNGGVVVNELGADVDFRIESDTDANAFFVQGSDGFVGIGTSSPVDELHLTANNPAIRLEDTTNSAYARVVGVDGDLYLDSDRGDSAANSFMRFSVDNSEKMRITSAGNVGIGTTSPTRTLHVNSGTTDTGVLIESTDAVSIINMKDSTSTGDGISFGVNGDAFIVNSGLSTERMRLNASGSLGLGVTPSAWGSGFKAAQIGVGASLAGRTANFTQFYLMANSYFDGSDFKYLSSAPASYYHNDNGGHYWFNAPSGTAGNTISFTQALTLNANGNLVLQGGSTGAQGRVFMLAGHAAQDSRSMTSSLSAGEDLGAVVGHALRVRRP